MFSPELVLPVRPLENFDRQASIPDLVVDSEIDSLPRFEVKGGVRDRDHEHPTSLQLLFEG
jgi:hypothetical protein